MLKNESEDVLFVAAAEIARRASNDELAEQLLLKAIDISNSIHGSDSMRSAMITLKLIDFYEHSEDRSKSLPLWVNVHQVLQLGANT